MVPVASVVVVVVVVSETWPHANGATHAKAMLNTIFFMFSPLLVELPQSSSPSFRLSSRFKELLIADSNSLSAADVCAMRFLLKHGLPQWTVLA
jgi:hypothetical protein